MTYHGFISFPRGRSRLQLAVLTATFLLGMLILFTTSSNHRRLNAELERAWLAANLSHRLPSMSLCHAEDPYRHPEQHLEQHDVEQWMDGRDFSDLKVVLYEQAIHDGTYFVLLLRWPANSSEVVGAIGKALSDIGVDPYIISPRRFKFDRILADVMPNPQTEYPNSKDHSIERRLDNHEVDVLILTTCRHSLHRLMDHIRDSDAHVVCFWHSGTMKPLPEVKADMHELAKQGRLTFAVLGNEVKNTFQFKLDEWTEKEHDQAWGEVPIENFAPVFDWPGETNKARPSVFPSSAIIQGNLQTFRRDYLGIFAELQESLKEDPSIWGYRAAPPGSENTYEPVPDQSPFKLYLMGQPVARTPLVIPDSLSNIVSVHGNLEYPDYYHLLSSSDLLLPAFAQASYYFDAASSSIAAALIGRVPILGCPRLMKAYDYVGGASLIKRDTWVTEVAAIKRLRQENAYKIPSDADWKVLFGRITDRNSAMWARIMGRSAKLRAERQSST